MCVGNGLALRLRRFLNKDPQDKQTNDTYWQTETSLRTYAQDFYSSYFTGYGTDYTVFAGYFSGDDYTDDFINLNNANTNGSGYIYFSTSATTDWNSQTGTWSGNYSVIYKANVMLEKIPGMNISDEARDTGKVLHAISVQWPIVRWQSIMAVFLTTIR